MPKKTNGSARLTPIELASAGPWGFKEDGTPKDPPGRKTGKVYPDHRKRMPNTSARMERSRPRVKLGKAPAHEAVLEELQTMYPLARKVTIDLEHRTLVVEECMTSTRTIELP